MWAYPGEFKDAKAAGQVSATESAQICRSAVLLIRELLVRPDEGSMLPSRFPLNMLENNAVEAMMQICSSPVCPPAILPPDRPMDLPPNFTSIKANHPYAAAEGPPRTSASATSRVEAAQATPAGFGGVRRSAGSG